MNRILALEVALACRLCCEHKPGREKKNSIRKEIIWGTKKKKKKSWNYFNSGSLKIISLEIRAPCKRSDVLVVKRIDGARKSKHFPNLYLKEFLKKSSAGGFCGTFCCCCEFSTHALIRVYANFPPGAVQSVMRVTRSLGIYLNLASHCRFN